jgi:hypothetical protein
MFRRGARLIRWELQNVEAEIPRRSVGILPAPSRERDAHATRFSHSSRPGGLTLGVHALIIMNWILPADKILVDFWRKSWI